MTTSTTWKAFGASVTGPGHAALGLPNQDAWSSFHHLRGAGLVVSDGLGSKPLSDFGSRAACWAVEHAARRFALPPEVGGRGDVLTSIRNYWSTTVVPLGATHTAATCLFAFQVGDGNIRVGILGDGCAAAVRTDGSVEVLMEDKTRSFSNITEALSPTTESSSWTVLDVPERTCEAIVLCTDGVSDDLADVEGFMAGLVRSCRGLAQVTASHQVRRMLVGWPVPKHSDDKTLACLRRTEDSDD